MHRLIREGEYNAPLAPNRDLDVPFVFTVAVFI
jgi:hypothetical protein